MSAKEMFKELNYTFKDYKYFIEYSKTFYIKKMRFEKTITFFKNEKKIDMECEYDNGYEWEYSCFECTIEEQHAINKQVEELEVKIWV